MPKLIVKFHFGNFLTQNGRKRFGKRLVEGGGKGKKTRRFEGEYGVEIKGGWGVEGGKLLKRDFAKP